MQRFLSVSLACFVAVCLLCAAERPAFAYVDPGSGFVALQSIASILAAAGYFLRRRIALFFSRKNASSSLPFTAKANQSPAE